MPALETEAMEGKYQLRTIPIAGHTTYISDLFTLPPKVGFDCERDLAWRRTEVMSRVRSSETDSNTSDSNCMADSGFKIIDDSFLRSYSCDFRLSVKLPGHELPALLLTGLFLSDRALSLTGLFF